MVSTKFGTSEWSRKLVNLIVGFQAQTAQFSTRATNMLLSQTKTLPLKCSIWRLKRKKMNSKAMRMQSLIYVSITIKMEPSFLQVLIAHSEFGNDQRIILLLVTFFIQINKK